MKDIRPKLTVTCPECHTVVTVPPKAIAVWTGVWAGSHKSPAKAASSRKNGASGGRPVRSHDEIRQQCKLSDAMERPQPGTLIARLEPLEASTLIAMQMSDLTALLMRDQHSPAKCRAVQKRLWACRSAIRKLVSEGHQVDPAATAELL